MGTTFSNEFSPPGQSTEAPLFQTRFMGPCDLGSENVIGHQTEGRLVAPIKAKPPSFMGGQSSQNVPRHAQSRCID